MSLNMSLTPISGLMDGWPFSSNSLVLNKSYDDIVASIIM